MIDWRRGSTHIVLCQISTSRTDIFPLVTYEALLPELVINTYQLPHVKIQYKESGSQKNAHKNTTLSFFTCHQRYLLLLTIIMDTTFGSPNPGDALIVMHQATLQEFNGHPTTVIYLSSNISIYLSIYLSIRLNFAGQ